VKRHKNYHVFKAPDHYRLGLALGRELGLYLRQTLRRESRKGSWKKKVERAVKYLPYARKFLPRYIDEYQGYARGAGVAFLDMWTVALDDELGGGREKCTTIITNSGRLISHNEDWEAGSEDRLCVVRKTVGRLTTLELFYKNTVGGNAVGINSRGFVHAVNEMHAEKRLGVPRDLIARWLADSSSPEKDFWRFARMRRSSGDNHIFVGPDGEIWNIESTAGKQTMIRPPTPFVHANHYLTGLKRFQTLPSGGRKPPSTLPRYSFAKSTAREKMTVDQLQSLADDESQGIKNSLTNETTIGKMIVDLDGRAAWIWLRREKSKGWIKYEIDWIK